MFKRQTSGSVICPSCQQLVSVKVKACPYCDRPNPGMWGYGKILRRLGVDLGFLQIVTWGCLTLYILTLLVDIGGIRNDGALNLLSPSGRGLFLFGASGSLPVFTLGRWWTVLSSGWLHGSLIHIAFNLVWIHQLIPNVAKIYGAARLVIIYTVAAIGGAFLTSFVAHYLGWLPDILDGANITIGASGAIFGLFGALVAYGQIHRDPGVLQQAWTYAVVLFVLGFLMSRVDNWGHLGGFLGGYAVCYLPWLNPRSPETQYHLFGAIACLALTLLSIGVSIITGLEFFALFK
ncbi:MAG: rhomboid family intramembrane serine protease [Chroococcales cyanobacterium]